MASVAVRRTCHFIPNLLLACISLGLISSDTLKGSSNGLNENPTAREDAVNKQVIIQDDLRAINYPYLPETGRGLPTAQPAIEDSNANRKPVGPDLPGSKRLVFTEEPQPKYEAKEGNQIELKCRTDGYPKPTVTWLKNGKEVTGYHLAVYESGDLHIKLVQYQDTGQYQCIARNGLEKIRSKQSTLKVLGSKPVVIKEESQLKYEALEGTAIVLKCHADGNPKPIVMWQKNGKQLTGTNTLHHLPKRLQCFNWGDGYHSLFSPDRQTFICNH